METVKKSPIYNDILKKFPDAELIDVRPKDNEGKND